jgi:hypothetical protein
MWPFRDNIEEVYLCCPYDLGELLDVAVNLAFIKAL